jgi:glutaminyl-peptide cyclotransferase
MTSGAHTIANPGSRTRPYWLAIAIATIVLLAAAIVLAVFVRTNQIAAKQAPKPAPIDAKRAYGYLKKICEIGPRIAGSKANATQRSMVAEHFKKLDADVREQPFQGIDPSTNKRVNMVNLIGSWNPDRKDRVVFAAHYDTRPYPDQDANDPKGEFIGANDGASGVALLMELAHHMKDLETPWGVDLVLLDGEELVYKQFDEYFLGSKAFSKLYKRARERDPKSPKYAAGFILDMVGDKDLMIPPEANSLELAPRLVRDFWGVAKGLKSPVFSDAEGPRVLDDHLSFNEAGIPTVDIIDFDYPFWHTTGDLPEECSGESLAEVGKVITSWLTQPKPSATGSLKAKKARRS